MRYYELNETGKVKGSYAVPQPDKVLYLLEDAPDNESMRDGVPGDNWIPDQEKIDARLAEEARIAAKAQAIIDNLPSWAAIETAIDKVAADVNAATTLAMVKPAILALVVIVKKSLRVLYWIATDKAD